MNKRILIGVDFGGTKIMTGAISKDGSILCEPVRVPTNSKEEPAQIIKRLTDSIEVVFNRIGSEASDVAGIGLGVTGPISIKKGMVLDCPQLPTLHYFPLRKKIQNYFSLPVFMNNDANCLIYGEVIFGSGMGKNNVVGFTLGTGLGCAIIIDQKIFNGSTESAGEIWPSPYRNGMIEDFVSGAGVSKIYSKVCRQSGSTTPVEKSSLEIAKLAEEGDPSALKTWEEFGRHLSIAMAWTINIIDPDAIILGGSITKAYRFFTQTLVENLRKNISSIPAKKINISRAKLGTNAGFIGAASLVLQKKENLIST